MPRPVPQLGVLLVSYSRLSIDEHIDGDSTQAGSWRTLLLFRLALLAPLPQRGAWSEPLPSGGGVGAGVGGQPGQAGAGGVHGVELGVSVAGAGEHDPGAVRRPG